MTDPPVVHDEPIIKEDARQVKNREKQYEANQKGGEARKEAQKIWCEGKNNGCTPNDFVLS